jgi:hypothetical protein
MEVTSDREKGRSRGPEIFRYVHENIRLLALHKHIEDVVTQNGVECTLRSLRCVVRVVAHDIESLFAEKVHVCSVTTSVVQYAAFDATEPEELSGREGRAVPFLGREMRIRIFATRHGPR